MEVVEAGSGRKEEEAERLLSGDLAWFVKYRKRDIPELLHVAFNLVSDEKSKEFHDKICLRQKPGVRNIVM